MTVFIALFLLNSILFAQSSNFDNTETMKNIKINNSPQPLVIVPDFGMSKLQYKYKDSADDWKILWRNVLRAAQYTTNFTRDFSPIYDQKQDLYYSAEHIDIQPVDFGGIEGIQYLDQGQLWELDGFGTLIKELQKNSYQAGVNLFGFPYDFRLAGAQQVLTNGMFDKLKQLIEQASKTNKQGGNSNRVHLLGHGLGCLFINHFLADFVTEQWKAQFIESFISVSGPYGGNVGVFGQLAGLKEWNLLPSISAFETELVTNALAGLYWQLPNQNIPFASTSNTNEGNNEKQSNDLPIVAYVKCKNATLTAKNMTWAFTTTGRFQQAASLSKAVSAQTELKAPNVSAHIFIAYSIDKVSLNRSPQFMKKIYRKKKISDELSDEKATTPVQILFNGVDGTWQNEIVVELLGEGDGEIPIKSLRAPFAWKGMQKLPVSTSELQGTSHSAILSDSRFINSLLKILLDS